jgi:hypothetical protein
LHASFQLSSSGEAIGLYSPNGVAQHALVFTQQVQNVSQGLFPDGNTNEFHFMTNWTPRAPNTLAAPLHITEISFDAGVVTLTWSAIPGRAYRVEFKDRLDAPAWAPLGSDAAAAGSSASVTDSPPPNAHRFYRIVRVN